MFIAFCQIKSFLLSFMGWFLGKIEGVADSMSFKLQALSYKSQLQSLRLMAYSLQLMA